MLTSSSTAENSASFSSNVWSRLKERTLLFRYLAEINLILGAWYLQWRIFHSLNFNALWFSVPLLLAEIYTYFGGVLFTIGLWRPLVRQVKSLDQMMPPLPRVQWPTVDVLVPCHHELPEIVEATAREALAIDYPVTKLRVYILDDSNSPAMRAMAEALRLEDLESPRLQQETERLQAELSQLANHLEQVDKLALDTEAAEAYLKNLPHHKSENPTIEFLQTLQKLMQLLDPNDRSVTERLAAERQRTIAAIQQKEKELAELARCHYIARPKPIGKALYTKASHLNYVISSGESSGDFIVVLEADHLPKPQFLKRVLPYFYTYRSLAGQYENNQVAFVQTPQKTHNIPLGDLGGHSVQLFYGPIQQGKDGLNSAFYTGASAVLRREALVSVGLQQFADESQKEEIRLDEFDTTRGASSNSIIEDTDTAIRFYATGWRSVYHSELLVEGLAPDDLTVNLKHRLRWAQAILQVLLRENPLTKPGLTFWQRLQYFQALYSYFSGFATAIFVCCPIIYFLTGIVPINPFGSEFALHFIPAYLLNRLTFLAASWGLPAKEIWRSEQYSVAVFPLWIQAVVSVFIKRPIKLPATLKQHPADIYYYLVQPQLIIFGLTVLSLLGSCGLLLIDESALWPVQHYLDWKKPEAFIFNAIWAVYNLLLLWAIIRPIWYPQPTPAKSDRP